MMAWLEKILLVEDDPDIRFVAEMALSVKGGFHVHISASAIDALQVAPSFRPDLVLLDVRMPEMNGLTLMKRLREIPETSRTPVIFMTAKVQQHEKAQYLESGAIDVISKPFDPMTISQQIRDIWNKVQVDQETYEDRSEELKQRYLVALPDKIQNLEVLVQDLRCNPEDRELLEQLATAVHRICGSAGTYGLDNLTNATTDWERAMITMRERRTPPSARELQQIQRYLTSVKNLIRNLRFQLD